VGLDVVSSVGLPSPFPLPCLEAAFCTLAPAGALFPPSISTPSAPLNQLSGVPGVTLGLPSMVPLEGLGLSAPSSVGFSLGPNFSLPTTSDHCGTPSLSDNLSSSGSKYSEGSRIRYSLREHDCFIWGFGQLWCGGPSWVGLGVTSSSSIFGKGTR
jgi:hypothetical protein